MWLVFGGPGRWATRGGKPSLMWQGLTHTHHAEPRNNSKCGAGDGNVPISRPIRKIQICFLRPALQGRLAPCLCCHVLGACVAGDGQFPISRPIRKTRNLRACVAGDGQFPISRPIRKLQNLGARVLGDGQFPISHPIRKIPNGKYRRAYIYRERERERDT